MSPRNSDIAHCGSGLRGRKFQGYNSKPAFVLESPFPGRMRESGHDFNPWGGGRTSNRQNIPDISVAAPEHNGINGAGRQFRLLGRLLLRGGCGWAFTSHIDWEIWKRRLARPFPSSSKSLKLLRRTLNTRPSALRTKASGVYQRIGTAMSLSKISKRASRAIWLIWHPRR